MRAFAHAALSRAACAPAHNRTHARHTHTQTHTGTPTHAYTRNHTLFYTHTQTDRQTAYLSLTYARSTPTRRTFLYTPPHCIPPLRSPHFLVIRTHTHTHTHTPQDSGNAYTLLQTPFTHGTDPLRAHTHKPTPNTRTHTRTHTHTHTHTTTTTTRLRPRRARPSPQPRRRPRPRRLDPGACLLGAARSRGTTPAPRSSARAPAPPRAAPCG